MSNISKKEIKRRIIRMYNHGWDDTNIAIKMKLDKYEVTKIIKSYVESKSK